MCSVKNERTEVGDYILFDYLCLDSSAVFLAYDYINISCTCRHAQHGHNNANQYRLSTPFDVTCRKNQASERKTSSSRESRMHSIYQRFNNLTALLSSCLLALVAVISLSSFLFTADPKGSLAVTNIKVYVLGLWGYPSCGKILVSGVNGFWWCRFPGNARYYRQKNREFSFVKFNATAGACTSHCPNLLRVDSTFRFDASL